MATCAIAGYHTYQCHAALQVKINCFGCAQPKSECRTVGNGRELLDLLGSPDSYIPDVVLLNINMPVMDGWECLRALKRDQRYAEIPAIMYAISSARQDVEKAYQLGASLFLSKPEDFDELCRIVEVVAVNPTETLLAVLDSFHSPSLLMMERDSVLRWSQRLLNGLADQLERTATKALAPYSC